MPYFSNVPQANQRISASQPQIQANFTALQQIISVDHATFTAPAGDQGKHNRVSFLLEGAAPVFAAGEFGLYNLAAGLFVHNPIHANDYNIGDYVVAGANTRGSFILPCGIMINWGRFSTTALPNPTTVTFTTPFPNICYNVVLTPTTGTINNPVFIGAINALGAASFTMNCYRADATGPFNPGVFYYIAIGR